MIAPHIALISAFLSVTWGAYFIYTIKDYLVIRTKNGEGRRRGGDAVAALRRTIVAFCLWSFCFSFLFRTAMVLLGFGEDVVGQVVFFTLVGTNVLGSVFALVSLKYD